jgi:hypothetical protein
MTELNPPTTDTSINTTCGNMFTPILRGRAVDRPGRQHPNASKGRLRQKSLTKQIRTTEVQLCFLQVSVKPTAPKPRFTGDGKPHVL